MLAFAAGAHATTIRWQPSNVVSYGPESGAHGLQLEIAYTGGAVRSVSFTEKKSDGREPAIANVGRDTPATCESLGALEIEVEVAVTSDGGALDERMRGTLFATSPLWAALVLPLDLDELGGAFAISDLPAGVEPVQVALEFGLSPLGVRGELSGVLQQQSGGATSALAHGPFATIGDVAGCEGGGLAIAIDDEVGGLRAQAGLDAVAALGPQQATWRDGVTTEVTLQLSDDRGPVCALLEPNLLAANEGPLLRLGGRLVANSKDARLAADWPVTIEVRSDQRGELGGVSVSLDHKGLESIRGEDLARVYGVPQLQPQLSGFDGYQVAMELALAIEQARTQARFALRINGLRYADCARMPEPQPEPRPGEDGASSSPGCPGAQITELESLEF